MFMRTLFPCILAIVVNARGAGLSLKPRVPGTGRVDTCPNR